MVYYYVIEELDNDELLYYIRYNWLNYCNNTYFKYLPKDIINIIIDYIPKYIRIPLQLNDIISYDLGVKKYYCRLVYKLYQYPQLTMQLDRAKKLKSYPKINIITSNGVIYFDIIKNTVLWKIPLISFKLNDKYKYFSSLLC